MLNREKLIVFFLAAAGAGMKFYFEGPLGWAVLAVLLLIIAGGCGLIHYLTEP